MLPDVQVNPRLVVEWFGNKMRSVSKPRSGKASGSTGGYAANSISLTADKSTEFFACKRS